MLLSFVNGSSSVIWLVLECATCVLNQNSNQKFITADLSKDSEQQAEDLYESRTAPQVVGVLVKVAASVVFRPQQVLF